MVTSAHEGVHRIFQQRPEVLKPVFDVLGVALPEKATVDAITPDVTETRPLERRIDTLLRISTSDGDEFLLAVEAQERRDARSPGPRAVGPARPGEARHPRPRETRDRITSCTDLDTLTQWFDRSLTATTAEDLFVEE
ncbi:hypothetical protein [Streptomyces sp. Go-475]|uniref:hypothetical protein n=1 Tax=Streptomyces sp. Go-475 TaxID=2072505 RepID=UPI000DF08B9B|nr:hypothetical protein [Streptomyces sp. Go-475]AXE87294.1 hypothetical protein C1703_20060 [Streptomyces sp. Go-475]